jgi:hypothetical protein
MNREANAERPRAAAIEHDRSCKVDALLAGIA